MAKTPARLEMTPSGVAFLSFVTAVASIGGLVFGYDTSVISGASLYLYDDIGPGSDLTKQMVVSLMLLGALVGSLLGGAIANWVGRKATILVSDILYILGSAIMGFSSSILGLEVGRFIGGLGVGVTAMVVPMYLAEISPEDHRGTIITIYTLCIALGQCGSVLVCIALGDHWRWMLGVAAFAGLAQGLGMLMCPETPKWLISKGNSAAANRVLSRFYHLSDVSSSEFLALRPEVTTSSYSSQLREVFGSHMPALSLGVTLQALQQLVGINTVMYYGPSIMQKAGFGGQALIAALPLFVIAVVGTAAAIVLIDRAGRRALLLWTIPVMSTALFCLSYGFYIIENGNAGKLCLVAMCAYVLAFTLGMGPVPWIVCAEIFPTHLRSAANSITTATNWVFNAIVCMTFLSLSGLTGGSVAVWTLYACFGGLSWLVVYHFLPETKGTNLHSVLQFFQSTPLSTTETDKVS